MYSLFLPPNCLHIAFTFPYFLMSLSGEWYVVYSARMKWQDEKYGSGTNGLHEEYETRNEAVIDQRVH